MPLPRRLFSRRHAAVLIIAVLGGSAVAALPAAAPADSLVATSVALSTQPTVAVGQFVQVTATVTPTDPSPGPVTGTVTFSVDGVAQPLVNPWPFPGPAPTAAPVADGVASIQLYGLSGGSHQVTADYSGTDLYGGSSTALGVTVAPDQSAISLTLLTARDGTLQAIAANVEGTPPSAGVASGGAMQLYLDGVADGPAQTVSNGLAVFPVNIPPGTPHTVSVSYAGSASYLPSTQSQYVAPWGSSVNVTLVPGPTSTVVANATVSSLPAGAGTPDGSVQFVLANEGTPIGSPVPLVNGAASSIPVVLASGDLVEADYSGSTSYRASANSDNPSGPAPTSPPASAGGYWMVSANGTVYGFGGATVLGSAPVPSGQSAVGLASTPGGLGYWIASNRGAVYSFGNARYLGGNPALAAGEAVTSISATPDGAGYRLFTNKGRVFDYGSAANEGDLSALKLSGPILASETTPSGVGYYMVGSDGGIFSFGDAAFWGSMASTKLNGPVNGIVPTSNDGGYWLVASDGGVFSFGDAAGNFLGSMGGHHLNKPIIGMVAYGNGYLMVASDGGIFDFSSSPFAGSLGANPPSSPIVGVTALP